MLTPRPYPPRFKADAGAAGVVGRAGPFAKVRLLQPDDNVSKFFVVVSVFVATMPRSRPVHTLLFPLHLANAAVAGAAGRWLAGRGTPEARSLLRFGCGRGKVNAV